MHDFCASRVRMLPGREIQPRLKCREKRLVGRLVGTWAACRRHEPPSQLAHDPFPGLRIISYLADVDRVENEVPRLETRVMTPDAVAIEQRSLA